MRVEQNNVSKRGFTDGAKINLGKAKRPELKPTRLF